MLIVSNIGRVGEARATRRLRGPAKLCFAWALGGNREVPSYAKRSDELRYIA